MFSEIEQKVIEEKIEQLQKVRDGVLSPSQLAQLITERRVSWFNKNQKIVLAKHKDLPEEEKAYRIIFFEHMQINPEHSEIIKVQKGKILVKSRNFCPYLEACKRLKLDTKFMCKQIGEPSIQKICEMINPKLKFSRNYSNIRPGCHFCEEYIELS